MSAIPPPAGLFDELAHARDTGELLAAGQLVVRGALADALRTCLDATNPLADHPSVRMVEAALRDEERTLAWGRAAAEAVPVKGDWPTVVGALLAAAGGVLGDEPPGEEPSLPLRSAAGPPAPDRVVRRDERFVDPYNQSPLIDRYCDDPERPADERAYALVAAAHGEPLLTKFQDFDWADEVLHARTGRRWIVSEFPSRAGAPAQAGTSRGGR